MAKRVSITDQIISGQLNLLRLEAGTRLDALRMLERMKRDIVSQLAGENLTTYTKARLNSLLSQVSQVIKDYYSRIGQTVDDTLVRAGTATAKQAADTLNRYFMANIGASLPSDTFIERLASNTLIMGAASADWWERQGEDTAFRFANVVRQGIMNGDTTEEIVSRVTGGRGSSGIMDVARSNARSLIHTSIMEVANAARNETWQQNSDVVDGVRQVSTLDSHTTEICIAYDGAEFTLDGEPMDGTDLPYDGGVPRHWGCRSVEVPITKSFKDLGINIPEPDVGERASADGPVPADTTFDSFITRMGKDFQDETLGPGRAELWRDGKITLQQLLDLKGNPLSLSELEDKYG